jgi:hypothetical protein
MARKAPDGSGKAAAINFRTEAALRDQIEQAAKKAGRSIAEEVEARLYASFDLDLTERDGIRTLLSRRETADFCNDLGKIFSDIRELGRRRGFDELQTREAMKAALGVLSFYYLWTGEAEPPELDGPEPAPNARINEYPPKPLGHEVANNATVWNAAWRQGSVIDETTDGQISDVWSGDGTKIVRPGRESVVPPRADASDLQFETPERLKLYRPVRSFRMKSDNK